VTLSQKHSTLKRAGGVTQGGGPEFKHQHHKIHKYIKLQFRIDVVAHTCNSSYQEMEIRRIIVQGQPGQKVRETTTSTKKARCGDLHCYQQVYTKHR
jgi:hypothetical protein